MRISRKDKKTMRHLLLCWCNNPDLRKAKIAKLVWLHHKKSKLKWFRLFSNYERKISNKI